MPLYSYKCKDGHTFDLPGRMDGSDAPSRCIVFVDRDDPSRRCDAAVERVIAAPARVFPGADSWRR